MAITQISRITQRKGLQVDLPRLAGAEFGWSTDSRRLFIGNGTLEEGAPVVGNTEILTEFSDIIKVNASYTYEGDAAGYRVQTGPSIDDPVTMTLQQWMDQWVTIKDFGAVGDGITDDTAAINRALYEIYCRDVNPQVRRAIYFPAGVYKVTGTILVPPYATLYGEGADNSIIFMPDTTVLPFVMRTTDSDQQYDINMGSNGAVLPTNVTLSNLCISSADPTMSLLLLEDVTEVRIESVSFVGPLNVNEISTDTPNSSALRFRSKSTLITNTVVLDKCQFSGLTYGINANDYETGVPVEVKGVTVNESRFNNLYQGVVLGTTNASVQGPTGFRIINNVFDGIYTQAIFFGSVILNVSAYNIFYDCGSHLLGDEDPFTSIIEFLHGDNVSLGDMFARSDLSSRIKDPGNSYPRIVLNNQPSIAMTNGSQINVGTYVRKSGALAELQSSIAVPTPITISFGNFVSVNSLIYPAFAVDYMIVRGSTYRTGTITVSCLGSAPSPVWSDDFTENEPSGILLSVEQINEMIAVMYTSNSGLNATFSFSIRTFDHSPI